MIDLTDKWHPKGVKVIRSKRSSLKIWPQTPPPWRQPLVWWIRWKFLWSWQRSSVEMEGSVLIHRTGTTWPRPSRVLRQMATRVSQSKRSWSLWASWYGTPAIRRGAAPPGDAIWRGLSCSGPIVSSFSTVAWNRYGIIKPIFFRSNSLLAVPAGLFLHALWAAPAASLPRFDEGVFVDVGGKCLLATTDLNHRFEPGFRAQG